MSNISVDYDVLNQRGSPAWYTDTFANIPTAGYKGRMFISTDTFAFYRDTGTGWDLIGGPGTGTITGSGVSGQVSYFNGTQVLAGSNNLFWDNTNSRLGINTITPGQALDVHGTANTLVQLNNTTTGNSNISFQNQDVAKWRVGNLYNAGANSFDIQNATTSTTPFSINSTTNLINVIGIAIKSNGSSGVGLIWDTAGGMSIGDATQTTIAPVGSYSFGFYFGGATKAFYFDATNITSQRQYLLPNTAGTLALTSNLSAYLPLAGGTMTGLLILSNPTISSYGLQVNNSLGNPGFVAYQNADSSYALQVATTGATTINLTSNASASYINTTANFGFGTSSPAYKLEIIANAATWGARIYNSNATGNGLVVATNNTTTNGAFGVYNGTSYILYCRNDGEVLVGTTSNTINSSNFGIRLAPDGTFQNSRNVNGSSSVMNVYGNAGQMLVYGNGNIQNTNGSYGTISDLRLKDNIINSTSKLEDLLKVRIVNYNLKKYPNQKLLGVVAQELEEIFPALIETNEQGYKGVKYSIFIPMLIKAIQELNDKLVKNNIN